jgi:hypothetical protein
MRFLHRILGGSRANDGDDEASTGVVDDKAASVDPAAEERQHELDVLRAEAERLDELTQRQLKYADHAWQPPAQGGERRADDGDAGSSA